MAVEERLNKKKRLYDEIDSLDDDQYDKQSDDGLQSSVSRLKPSHSRTKSKGSGRLVASSNSFRDAGKSLPRSSSDTNMSAKARSAASRELMEQPPSSTGPRAPPSLSTRHTFAGALPPSSAIPSTSGKRKRDSAIVPDDQRFFDGLHFYFFPNNDRHPGRQMRILRAIDYGATWQRDFSEHVTHIVLDKAMGYDMLLKYLKLDALPSNMRLVNESWPPDCIAHRMLLEPSRPQFRVHGAPAEVTSIAQPPMPTSSAESTVSLKLKPAGKDVMTRQPETQKSDERPSTEEEPSANSSVDHRAVDEPSDRVKSSDELEAAIDQARQLDMMPLDEEDTGSRPNSADGDDGKASTGRYGRKLQTMQGEFQCMQKHTGEGHTNPNAPTIQILQQMAEYYGQTGDEWRIRAYRKAIATLRNHPKKVRTREEAQALPNVGERLATKIEEIAFTNRLRRLDNARAEPSDQAMQTFMKVYGVGFNQASSWVRQGYTTLDELLQKATLTDNQRVGIDHYEDFLTRVPRSEVEQHGHIVRRTLQKIDPAFQVTIGGSYRRGAASSGDIDCIITRPDTGANHICTVVLDQLVPKLFATDYFKKALAVTSRDEGSKWHGACCLPGSKIWRRIDLMLVPWAELGAAMITYTGNDIFNRSLRLLASTKGMRLNQRGLYRDAIRDKGREKLTEGTLLEGRDEKRIFEILGVPWRPPEHRVP